ncbi:hypothetical protein H1Z61_16915 [Bacillus aquiflavi]|uniref:Uncharacterized protein n=1 Tax=Bacillus aquiflavi TaxID=2672567 RepID=A0A7W1X6X0_9BACI|nr:hypothetical protein [Bacillus aquiflavi]MBA4538761.1 hypothetical protein [Bacillus aquiflavi]UAC48647.1 hypothetical protein K6959_01225 [Bacillus aquiflavi]
MSKKKKKYPLYIGEEYYGSIPIEEAFHKALAPYFNTEKSTEDPKEKMNS